MFGILSQLLMENPMMECSLSYAIERCKKDGGSMHVYNDLFYKWDKEKKYFTNSVGGIVESFSLKLIESTWIYKPPKQSAFQEWAKTSAVISTNAIQHKKEGWNAAIDKVLKIMANHSPIDVYRTQNVKELKED